MLSAAEGPRPFQLGTPDRHSTGGPDGDRFKRYVAEVVSLDKFLPKHTRPQNGVAIVDGADPDRAVFPTE